MPDDTIAEEHQLLCRKWHGHTLHETYALDEGRVLKRYWVRPGIKHFPRPWQMEHLALVRLSGMGFGETYGYSERPHNNGWEAALSRDHIQGSPAHDLTGDDIPELAVLMSSVHRRGILLGNITDQALIRCPGGGLCITDFGDARVCRTLHAVSSYRMGREILRIGLQLTGPDGALARQLLDAYLAICALSHPLQQAVKLGFYISRTRRDFRRFGHLDPRGSG